MKGAAWPLPEIRTCTHAQNRGARTCVSSVIHLWAVAVVVVHDFKPTTTTAVAVEKSSIATRLISSKSPRLSLAFRLGKNIPPQNFHRRQIPLFTTFILARVKPVLHRRFPYFHCGTLDLVPSIWFAPISPHRVAIRRQLHGNRCASSRYETLSSLVAICACSRYIYIYRMASARPRSAPAFAKRLIGTQHISFLSPFIGRPEPENRLLLKPNQEVNAATVLQ